MDYRQFMKFMEQGKEPDKESISILQDYVKEFPYFQSAQALLAKSMHVHQHVRFEKQLKIVSAYAGDRKTLYDLIHLKNGKLINDNRTLEASPFAAPLLIESNDREKILIEEVIENVKTPVEEETKIDLPVYGKIEKLPPVTFYSEENESPLLESDYDELPVADPHDIIRRRLIEILGLKEDKKEDLQAEQNISGTKNELIHFHPEDFIEPGPHKTEKVIEDTIIFSEIQSVAKDTMDQLIEESSKAVDFIQKVEIEYAIESTLIHSLEKLPVIESQIKVENIPVLEEKKENSFYDWLKIKTVHGFGRFEEIHAYESETIFSPPVNAIAAEYSQNIVLKENEDKKAGDITLLIDRFIQTNPKIIPSKTDFYSPSNQAKKSITENEDIVSETLAKIYHQQGNLLKARSSYQKLSLLYPEKMAYFAALIFELEKKINNLDKQGL